jgi:demethylmenaquinone methyltransferase / 2-methoxy-6-polyprenyl-1,4-benzoquinol methylase
MFSRVTRHYDRLNRLMTGGFDRVWRKEVIRLANLQGGMRVLDLGAGTGDLARLALAAGKNVQVVAADFTLEMMLVGRSRGDLPFVAADALLTPFTEGSFDVIVSGFLLRNVGNLDEALSEQFHLLKPGGRIVILETTRPARSLFTPFVWLHMHLVIPVLGRLFSRNQEAYEYLSQSSERFLSAEELKAHLERTGFTAVGFKREMAGTIAIHWGRKPFFLQE